MFGDKPMNDDQLYLYNLEIANREHTKWLEVPDDELVRDQERD